MRCWLYERIMGSPARLCEHAANTAEFRAKVADLPRTLFSELVSALEREGRRYLDKNGLAHEPLQWSPPKEVAQEWWATGRRPTVDVSRLHDLVGSQNMTLGAAAAEVGIPIEGVREALHKVPLPRRPLTPAQHRATGGVMADTRKQLSRARFIDLYVHEGLSLTEIGAIANASRQVVGRLAREYEIPLRPPNDVGRTEAPQ